LVFASLPTDTLIDFETTQETLISKSSDETQRALNGPRCAKYILDHVPNASTFQLVLSFVKYWARQRGLYQNVYGYLSGISCAIMVAYVCRLFPTSAPSFILSEFFSTFSNWNWSHPVAINDALDIRHITGGRDLFQIVTPCFPPMNSTYTVHLSTREILIKELKGANKVITSCKKRELDWSQLFAKFEPFNVYAYFVEIKVKTTNLVWVSFIESRIRNLVKQLESLKGKERIHPIPQVFHLDTCQCIYIGLKFSNFTSELKEIYLALQYWLNVELSCWKNKSVDMTLPTAEVVRRGDVPKELKSEKKRKDVTNKESTPTKKSM
jgi:poly(A) polymerase